MADDPTARALRLLSLLSSRPQWGSGELAGLLGVTPRTVRRDIDRLRQLGYQVDAASGTAGGYRLRAGAVVAPLFLDEDEAIAVVTALLVAAGDGTTGMLDSSARALGKLHQLLPARWLSRVDALHRSARALRSGNDAPQVEPSVVAVLAEACRGAVAVRFGYRTRDGQTSQRRVEPSSIVSVRKVWYLVGFDIDRDDWRLFRIDRMDAVAPTGHGAPSRHVPGGDPAAFVARSLAAMPYAHTADVHATLSVADVASELRWLDPRRVDVDADGRATIHLGSDSLDTLLIDLMQVIAADPAAAVVADPIVREHCVGAADRLRSAVTARVP